MKAHFKFYMKCFAQGSAMLAFAWLTSCAAGTMAPGPAAPGPVAPGPVAPGPVAKECFADALWDDGRAEMDVYTGVTSRYGEPRPVAERMILVKEDLLRDALVKSDAGPVPGRTVTAIKLNTIADFLTGTYSYHQMSTVMCERATGAVLKETMSHTEGCGITFVRIGPRQGRLVHEAHSYFDGEADREVEVKWPAGERVYADALPLWLRRYAHLATPFTREVLLMPTQVSGRAPLAATQPVRASLALVATAPLQVPAGRFESVEFAVTVGGATDRYWFDRAAPHVMLKLETAAGRSVALQKSLRLDYWKHTANGDERLLD